MVCEPFTQWALEDHFAAGRPPYDEVGVQLVPDVTPYELMKLRLLNASHQALCYLGYLSGYRYAHEVCSDPLFVGFLLGYMDDEATPTLEPVPGVDLDAYKHKLIERFANPEIKDTLARLCAESSDRIPKWLLPVVRDQLADGGPIRRAALVVAAWARYAEGVDEDGRADRHRRQPQGVGHGPRAGAGARTRSRSCATPTCSATSSTTSGSPRSTSRPSTRCTSTAPAPRWRRGRTVRPTRREHDVRGRAAW